jgi:hypothetical protein
MVNPNSRYSTKGTTRYKEKPPFRGFTFLLGDFSNYLAISNYISDLVFWKIGREIE